MCHFIKSAANIEKSEPHSEKTSLLTCAPNEDSNQPAQSAQSDQSLRCSHEETLNTCLSKMRLVKILIRLRESGMA